MEYFINGYTVALPSYLVHVWRYLRSRQEVVQQCKLSTVSVC